MKGTGLHIPNLLISQKEHDSRPVRFKGEHGICDFFEWLDTLTEEDTCHVPLITHTVQDYDGYFIVDEYHKQHRIVEQLQNGAKLLQVTFDRIPFIDSLSFFQMPPSTFSKTSGFTELKKRHFLQLFNVPENQDYVGPIPAKHFYMPESMSLSGRAEFEKWYAEQVEKNVEFDFQAELIEYCESHVQLLK